MAYGLASLVPRPFGEEGLRDEPCGLACLVDVGGGGGGRGEWGRSGTEQWIPGRSLGARPLKNQKGGSGK